MTDTILWRPGWTGLGRHCGVMSEVSDDRRVPLAGVGARGTNRVTDTIFARLDVAGLIKSDGSGGVVKASSGQSSGH
ncbi:MAG: hypothetical protein GX456_00925 [Verrucomicrobia bacterium]|nr:hypothetical protein [Verrucomicrobiota bacterium]